MKISVLIVAHNEEKYIKKCIESVLNQTKHPDEIVLLLHNSTDKTRETAESSPITIVPFNGPTGIVSARLEGLNHVGGDIILCIDGDSSAQNNWVEVMADTLKKDNNIFVGSSVKFKGTIFGNIYNIFNKYSSLLKGQRLAYWIWGSNFGFWGKDKNLVQKILKNSVSLSEKIGLPRNPEDYWLALYMNRHGAIEKTSKTFTVANTKDTSSIKEISRRIESHKNRNLMRDYFNANLKKLPL